MHILEKSVYVNDIPELDGGEAGRQSGKSRSRFAYQWTDNVKMYK